MPNTLLSQKTKDTIDKWLKKYPENHKRSAVLTALHAVQEQNEGWISTELMQAVAAYLDLTPIQVYEVATFYDMYDLKPAGKHKVKVCTNISCMLRGSDQILKQCEKTLGIKCGESTPDGRFKLEEVECLAACADAPAMQIDTEYHVRLDPEKVDAILKERKGK
jgi:NADH-quinone oxidoreductase subunit E